MTPPSEDTCRTIDDVLHRLADAESRLDSLRAEVEHLQRLAMVGTLAAGVVHEINNVLTPALGEAQIARLRRDDVERLRSALDQCIHSMTHAGRVAGTLIHFSLPNDASRCGDANTADESPAANIAQAIKATLTCLGRRPAEQGVDIQVQVPPDAWAVIEPLALQQVLLNLLLNALHALKSAEQPAVAIRAGRSSDGMIEIVMTDNGPGIPKEIRSTLFEPFTTAPVSDRTRRGAGLGLTISKRLVQMAGGSIEVESNGPRGAKFTIRLDSICVASREKVA